MQGPVARFVSHNERERTRRVSIQQVGHIVPVAIIVIVAVPNVIAGVERGEPRHGENGTPRKFCSKSVLGNQKTKQGRLCRYHPELFVRAFVHASLQNGQSVILNVRGGRTVVFRLVSLSRQQKIQRASFSWKTTKPNEPDFDDSGTAAVCDLPDRGETLVSNSPTPATPPTATPSDTLFHLRLTELGGQVLAQTAPHESEAPLGAGPGQSTRSLPVYGMDQGRPTAASGFRAVQGG